MRGEFITWLEMPPKVLSPNARVHFMAKANATRAYRQHAYDRAMLCLQGTIHHVRPAWRAASVQWEFHVPRAGRRDVDNLVAMMKSALDGITDSGLLYDDDQITLLPPTVIVDREDPFGSVKVTVREL